VAGISGKHTSRASHPKPESQPCHQILEFNVDVRKRISNGGSSNAYGTAENTPGIPSFLGRIG